MAVLGRVASPEVCGIYKNGRTSVGNQIIWFLKCLYGLLTLILAQEFSDLNYIKIVELMASADM